MLFESGLNHASLRWRRRTRSLWAVVPLLFAIGAVPAIAADPATPSPPAPWTQKLSAAPDFDAALADYTAARYADAVLQLFAYVEQTPPPADLGKAEFLLGLALLKSGGAKDAAFFFNEAEKHWQGFEDVAALYAARALEMSGDYAAASAVWERAEGRYGGSAHFQDAGRHRAKMLAKAKAHNHAARLYEEMAGSKTDTARYNEFRTLAGEQWMEAGRFDLAESAYRSVLDAKRVDRFTNRAFEGYESALRARHDGRLPASHRTFTAEYAERHWKDSRFRQAQPAYASLRDQGASFGADDRYRLGVCAFHNHDNDTALRELSAVASGASEEADDALYRLAKTRTRLGDNEGSRADFRRLQTDFPKSGYRRSAVYQLALIDMEDNQYDKAFRYFDERLKSPTGIQEEYLTWLKAWTAYRSGKPEVAEETLTHLLTKFKKSSQADRYLYWRAVVRSELRRKDDAVEDWKVLNQSPRTYYGLRAGQRLSGEGLRFRPVGGEFTGRGVGTEPVAAPEPRRFPESVRRTAEKAIVLESLGCHEEASRVAEELSSRVGEAADPSSQLAAAQLLRMTGHYYSAKKLALDGLYEQFRRYSNPLRESYWTYIYPRAFEGAVRDYATRWSLPEDLVYSIMLNESHFKPWVVSPANAIGLMQVVPRTADEIARQLGDASFESDDLYDPITNIRYGTWYLRAMLDRFGGNQICAVASYNAGPDVVGKWWRNKGAMTEEIFIEEIPYRETNQYVKKVLLTRQLYRELYEL